MSSGSFDKDDNKNFMVQDMGHLLKERIENRTAHEGGPGVKREIKIRLR